MRLSFTWKLGIVVALLSLALTGGCFYWFYVVSSGALTKQIGKNLLSVGRLGALMFDEEAQGAIKVNKYLASVAPLPTADGWPGNPIGNLTKGWTPPASAFAGKPYVDDRLYTDSFYTSLSAVVPLLDADGSFLAFLGIDYAATKEKNALILLQYISFGLIAGGLLFTALIAYYTARRLGATLRQLSDAAQRVAASDLTVVLDIHSNDEFAMVGRVFNRMIAGIRHAISAFDTKHRQLAAIIWYMHDRVGAILTAIAAETEKEGGDIGAGRREATGCLPTIHRLGRDGLTEVRFLMSALDYDRCDFSVLIEEIRMQGADLLAPAGVTLNLRMVADCTDTPLDFRDFLVLQRLFREIFTALGTGKKGGVCTVTMDLSGVETVMDILAPDHNENKNGSNGDRELSCLIAEAASYGCRLECFPSEGFHLRLHFPSPLARS